MCADKGIRAGFLFQASGPGLDIRASPATVFRDNHVITSITISIKMYQTDIDGGSNDRSKSGIPEVHRKEAGKEHNGH